VTSTPVAIVLAAGKGVRTASDRPKQVLPLGDRPVMAYAVDQHLRMGHRVVLVVSDAVRGVAREVVGAHPSGGAVAVVEGGATRRESVLAGIAAIPTDADETTAVILRNAASPNTADSVIESCLAGLSDHDGMQAYLASDSTTFIHDGVSLRTLVPRRETGFTCDPTVYRNALVRSVADEMRAGVDGETTLDIARALGASIGIVESSADNIKITTPDDLHRVAVAMGLD